MTCLFYRVLFPIFLNIWIQIETLFKQRWIERRCIDWELPGRSDKSFVFDYECLDSRHNSVLKDRPGYWYSESEAHDKLLWTNKRLKWKLRKSKQRSGKKAFFLWVAPGWYSPKVLFIRRNVGPETRGTLPLPPPLPKTTQKLWKSRTKQLTS